jgi:predicted ArsR family transcriptional regulator
VIFALGASTGSAPHTQQGAGARARVRPSSEITTRQRLTAVVSESGPITAGELAERLGLTPAAVRRHLDALAEDGLVEEHEKAGAATRRRGRPARAYVLTEAGHAELNDDYRDLAADVLRYLAAHGGDDAVLAFARQRAREFAAELPAGARTTSLSLEQRTEILSAGLRRGGYATSTRPVGEGTPLSGVQLCQGHCPVRDVAAEFPQLCEAEAEMFSDLLGVHVQRLATQAQGDHVCTTFIPLTATSSAAGSARTTPVPRSERDSR